MKYLEEVGDPYPRFFEDICFLYVQNGFFHITAFPPPPLRWKFDILIHLEEIGFLVSTEIASTIIAIKPLGHTSENETHMFCVKCRPLFGEDSLELL